MDSMRFSPKHGRMVAIEMWILTLSSPGRCSPYQKRSRTVPEPRMPRECHSCTQWRRLSFCCSHLRLHEIYDMLIYVTYVNHYLIDLLYLIVSYCPSTLHGSILDCFLGAAVSSCCQVFRNRGSSVFVSEHPLQFFVVLWLSWLFLEKLGRDHGGF